MINFLKKSMREISHVVWPTPGETKKYLTIVLSVLILFWIYLFIFSSLFSNILFGLKDFLNPSDSKSISTIPANLDLWSDIKIDAEDIKVETKETPSSEAVWTMNLWAETYSND